MNHSPEQPPSPSGAQFTLDAAFAVGTELGGGNASHLKTGHAHITLKFAHPIRQVRDERRGKAFGSGTQFALVWPCNEALVLSFE